jgi:hypothetical protein
MLTMSSLAADEDELDAMVGALAQEHGVPYPIFPAHAREGDPVAVGLEEVHRQALEWRHKLIADIKRRPKWVAEWRAEQELNRLIRELCEERGLRFMPHECPPWNAPDELPEDYRDGTGWAASLPQAVRLRRRLIAEIEGA